jgi:hypothetical protein
MESFLTLHSIERKPIEPASGHGSENWIRELLQGNEDVLSRLSVIRELEQADFVLWCSWFHRFLGCLKPSMISRIISIAQCST